MTNKSKRVMLSDEVLTPSCVTDFGDDDALSFFEDLCLDIIYFYLKLPDYWD